MSSPVSGRSGTQIVYISRYPYPAVLLMPFFQQRKGLFIRSVTANDQLQIREALVQYGGSSLAEAI